jgi:hypothetical protein
LAELSGLAGAKPICFPRHCFPRFSTNADDSISLTIIKQPIFIEGYDEKIKISDVTIANCVFEKAQTKGMTITNAVNIHLINNSGAGLE